MAAGFSTEYSQTFHILLRIDLANFRSEHINHCATQHSVFNKLQEIIAKMHSTQELVLFFLREAVFKPIMTDMRLK